jgi:hypothetical protein
MNNTHARRHTDPAKLRQRRQAKAAKRQPFYNTDNADHCSYCRAIELRNVKRYFGLCYSTAEERRANLRQIIRDRCSHY